MAAVIQVKRGSASSWTSANTVLAAGEIGFETDTNKMKVGDGSTAWSSLNYVDSIPSQTGNSGKYLTTNGTSASWGTVDALPSQTGNSGKYLTTNGTSASWGTLDLTAYADKNLTLNAQTGTTYTFVLADNGKLVTASNASAQTYTIPLNSSVAYPVGAQINIIQIGAGQVTIQGAGGVTVGSSGATSTAPRLRVQYSSATLIKAATDTWYVLGDIL